MKIFASGLVFAFLLSCGMADEPLLKITIPAADFDRQDFPVSVILPADLQHDGSSPVLLETTDGESKIVPCQISQSDEKDLSWIVMGQTKAGKERSFELNFEDLEDQAPKLSVEKNDSTLFIHMEDQPLLHYQYTTMPAPEGETELYERSGFIHPLYSPSGEILTWAQPPDHYHHVGLWNPWTKVSWKENHTDFWNLASGLGTVRFKKLLSKESGPVYAEFKVLQDHIAFVPPKPASEDINYSGEEVLVMEEEWIIRVWDVEDGYLLDFTSLLRNKIDESVKLDKYRYGGGLGYRATEKWNKNNSEVLTSEGKIRKNGDATRAKWCWIYGDLNGKQTGLLFMSDTKNYDFPQPMRIWPENTTGPGYQYFEFTPIREKDWILEPGKTYSQKYRIWVQEGSIEAAKAEQQWKQFIEALDQKISYLSN